MAEPLLVDMAIHQFDLARKLIGREPVSVYCESYNPAWSWFDGDAAASAIFRFADGTRFAFTGSWCAPGPGDVVERPLAGQRVRRYGDLGRRQRTGRRAGRRGEALPAAMADDPEEIAGSLVEFVDAVRTRRLPQSEVHSNVVSIAMVEAAVRSANTGYAVRIADVITGAHAEALATTEDPALHAALKAWPNPLKAVGLEP